MTAQPDPRPIDATLSVTKAARLLGYAPTHSLRDGLREAIGWYAADFERRTAKVG